MQSVMSHRFSEVPRAEIPRSSFNRSHGHKTTFDAGFLIPVFVDEALPGDTFNVKMHAFARMATPIHPLMDNMRMDTQFFAVPIRLLWENWERFNGAQDNPADSIDFTIPTVSRTGSGYSESDIEDYMGIPTKVTGTTTTSALPLRAYNLIWNEWYRDQNLQNSVVENIDDGPDAHGDYNLLRRGKRHDYFTSCLPWPQKGVAVDLPLGTSAPILSDGNTGVSMGIYTLDNPSTLQRLEKASGTDTLITSGSTPSSQLHADLSDATAATINELRQAFQIQKLLERDARGGTRYQELILSHFGVVSPDQRMQRPEYLGGGSSPVVINPIAQTSSTDVTTPQGNLAAMGIAHVDGHGFVKSFTEHCIVIGLVSVRADLTYQQGLNRMWSRSTRYDFYWPALAHIGEQAVLNKEIYYQGSPATDDLVFGYQERFAEMRYKPSLVTGAFRSNATTPLDAWHLSQEFGSLPVLDATFIQENPPVDRVIAVNTEPHFLFDSYFDFNCVRPMPLYGVPGMIDRF